MEKKIGKILASYRKAQKLSQIDLAVMLQGYGIHVSNAAVSTWEKDISLPNTHQFLALCKILNITDIYNEFIGQNPKDPLAGLNDRGKKKVMEYIELLLLSDQFRKEVDPILPFRRKIKWSVLSASAGTGEFLDEENFELIEVGEEVPAMADFGLALNGDSMEPRYHDNQAVWVQQTNTLKEGEIGIFYLDGMTYCKQLREETDGIYLISFNPAYPPIKVTDTGTFRIFGRVLN